MRARRWWAWGLVPVYWVGLRLKDALRRVGVLRVRRLGWPVVSVGSLSAGGAGKTPVVMALAELLQARGWEVDVLSRGYGRNGNAVERVDVDAESAAARFGDEPVLIARRTGAEVWVGGDRYAAGRAAETETAAKAMPPAKEEAGSSAALQSDNAKMQTTATATATAGSFDKLRTGSSTPLRFAQDDRLEGRVHLLDDGFQHRKLARTMDVVVVTAEDLEEGMLPAGNRREGLGALRRADAVVVREEESGRVGPRLQGWARRDAVVWVIRRRVGFSGGDLTESSVPGEGWVVFSGIARPADFLAMLHEAGLRVVGVVSFLDHHAYGVEDMKRLVEISKRMSARGFLTTEKDAVKLTPALRAELGAGGALVVARLEALFVEEEDVFRVVEARIA